MESESLLSHFKSPAKQKRSSDKGKSPVLSRLGMSPFKADEEAPISHIGHVAGVLVRLDEGITTNKEAIMSFIHDYHQEHGKAGDTIRALWLRLEDLLASVGTLATRLTFDYLAPSAWGQPSVPLRPKSMTCGSSKSVKWLDWVPTKQR
jgi:hypothetical protein